MLRIPLLASLVIAILSACELRAFVWHKAKATNHLDSLRTQFGNWNYYYTTTHSSPPIPKRQLLTISNRNRSIELASNCLHLPEIVGKISLASAAHWLIYPIRWSPISLCGRGLIFPIHFDNATLFTAELFPVSLLTTNNYSALGFIWYLTRVTQWTDTIAMILPAEGTWNYPPEQWFKFWIQFSHSATLIFMSFITFMSLYYYYYVRISELLAFYVFSFTSLPNECDVAPIKRPTNWTLNSREFSRAHTR